MAPCLPVLGLPRLPPTLQTTQHHPHPNPPPGRRRFACLPVLGLPRRRLEQRHEVVPKIPEEGGVVHPPAGAWVGVCGGVGGAWAAF